MNSPHPARRDPAARDTPGLPRRTFLKLAATAELGLLIPRSSFGQAAPDAGARKERVVAYLETLARDDGGYGWEDQAASHLTPTFGVIGAYRLLGRQPPRLGTLAAFVRTHHPFHIKKLERDLRGFEFQQIQSLLWLADDPSSFRDQVRGWKQPSVYPKQYEQHGYPVFRFELMAILCRRLLGMALDDLSPALIAYLDERRRGNGSFNNTPAADGGDGHVMNTWWGLQALRALGRDREKKDETIAWLRSCQDSSGGFTYQPGAEIGRAADVAYTWSALGALRQLGAEPEDRDACLGFLRSLENADGGFGDRPGWASNPLATYYALGALDALGAAPNGSSAVPKRSARLPSDMQVYSIQVEAHGKGSPAEAVELARALRIHLWGAKNARPAWIARAQEIADQRRVPVTFAVANEEYGTWVNVPGLGTYSHTSDLMAPAGRDLGRSLANQGVVSWPEFRTRRLVPLEEAGGRLVWQFGENEELVRILLDDSLQSGGFAAISTFHFGNPDFTNSEPFLYRYRGRLPFLALQDAHGDEPWWFADMTTGFRTLFLAREPTWDGWLDALRNDRVVAVRHDTVSRSKTWMHGGSREVLEFVRQRSREWSWWDNPEIRRPLVSIVVLSPADEFEVARPETGLALRVRCAWENTTQGMPRAPIAELVRVLVDGTAVSPRLVTRKRAAGSGLADHYHLVPLTDLAPGRHLARAVARVLATGDEVNQEVVFQV